MCVAGENGTPAMCRSCGYFDGGGPFCCEAGAHTLCAGMRIPYLLQAARYLARGAALAMRPGRSGAGLRELVSQLIS